MSERLPADDDLPGSPRGGSAPGPARQIIPRPARARPGPPAWWQEPGRRAPERITAAEVRAAFDRSTEPGEDYPGGPAPDLRRAAHPRTDRPAGVIPFTDSRPASVLCAIWEERSQARVLLTRRSTSLRSHTGQVSFPGGRIDPDETAVEAAVREAEEEVGLDPGTVEVIGQLEPLATLTSGSGITPFVALLPGRPGLQPNPDEVARAFSVELVELMAPGVHHQELWSDHGRTDHPVHFFDTGDETIWGATAYMLRELLDHVCPPG